MRPPASTYAGQVMRYWHVYLSRKDFQGEVQPLVSICRAFRCLGIVEALNLLIKAGLLWHHTPYAETFAVQIYLANQFLSQPTRNQIDRWIRENVRDKEPWLFSEQQLLTAICFTLLYARRKDRAFLRVGPFEPLGLALLSISDHLEPLRQEIPKFETLPLPKQKQRIAEFILRNGLFYHEDDQRHHIVRHYEMFCEIAPQMETHPHFVDLNKLYRCLTGQNLSTFFTMGVALLAAFPKVTPENADKAAVFVSIRTIFRRTTLARASRKFFQEIATTRGRFRKAYRKDLNVSDITSYNFLELRRHPLVRIQRDRAFCTSLRLVIERLGVGVHHRLLASLPESERGKYLTFCGALFEEYVRRMCLRMYPDGRFVSHIRYGNNLEAADGWIIYPGAAIVLEAKAARFTLEIFLSGSFGAFEDKFRESLLKGARQLDRTIQDFKAGLFGVGGFNATDLPTLFPVLLTLQYVPQDAFLSEFIREVLREEKLFDDASIQQLQIIHIEDLENLEGIIGSGKSLLQLLQRRIGDAALRDLPFSNFLFDHFDGELPENQHIIEKYRELLRRSAFQIFRERLRG